MRTGQFIGLLDGNLVVAGDELSDVLRDLLNGAVDDDSELVTLYYGDLLNDQQARSLVAQLEDQFEAQTFELLRGGQPLYPFIISVE